MPLFNLKQTYSMEDIINICNENNLITVDCLKDENMVSVEQEGVDCIFEFTRIDEDLFRLTWAETNSNLLHEELSRLN